MPVTIALALSDTVAAALDLDECVSHTVEFRDAEVALETADRHAVTFEFAEVECRLQLGHLEARLADLVKVEPALMFQLIRPR